MQKQKFFGFGDFETCFDLKKMNEIKKQEEVKLADYQEVKGRVYLAGWTYGFDLTDCKQNYRYAENKEDFLAFIDEHLNREYDDKNEKKLYFYFHNLNYDFQFIKNNLLNDFDNCELSVVGQEKHVYQFKLKNKYTDNEFIFLDSLNILRMRLSQFPEVDGLKKREDLLVQDMSIVRPLNHQATEDEIEYLYYDVMTLASGVFNYFVGKFYHMTTSGYAFKVFLEELDKVGLKRYFNLSKQGHIQDYDIKRLASYCYNNIVGVEREHVDVLKRLERYYKGGQTFINPKYQERLLSNVKVLDVNSLYPFAYTKCKIPYISNVNSNLYRKRVKYDNAKTIKMDHINKLFKIIGRMENKSVQDLAEKHFLTFTIIMDIELKDGLNFSPVSSGFCDEVIEIYEFIDPKVRNIKRARVVFAGSEYDLKNWKLFYNITNCELVEYYIFDILRSHELMAFRSIMQNWAEQKIYYSQKDTYDERERGKIKLVMNSLTGKFGEKIRSTLTEIIDHDFVDVPSDKINSRTLPIIISLISYARYFMSYHILKVPDRFVYCDTDSIAIIDITEEEIAQKFKLHKTDLGKFDLEKRFTKAIYMKPKTYVGLVDDKYKFTVAGCIVHEEKFSEHSLESMLKNDKVIGKKIIKTGCDDGVLLLENDFIFKGDEGILNQFLIRKKLSQEDYIKMRFKSVEEDEYYNPLTQDWVDEILSPDDYKRYMACKDKDSLYDSIVKST